VDCTRFRQSPDIPAVLFTAGFIDVAIFFLAQEDHKERVAQVESLLQRTVDSLAVEFDNELNIIERTLSGIGEVVAAAAACHRKQTWPCIDSPCVAMR
jgi:hypothetical protein